MKTSCIRLMRAIVSNELAVKYSWYGAKKTNFLTTGDMQNIIRKLHTDVTDEQISAPIKIWLAHTKERIGKQPENIYQE